MNGEWENLRREMEKLLGYPKGAFDPASPFLRDMERLNQVLGQGVRMMQEVFSPEAMRARIEAMHPDQTIFRSLQASQPLSIFKLDGGNHG